MCARTIRLCGPAPCPFLVPPQTPVRSSTRTGGCIAPTAGSERRSAPHCFSSYGLGEEVLFWLRLAAMGVPAPCMSTPA